MHFLEYINQNILWGAPMLLLIASAGVVLTIATRGVIFLKFHMVLKNTIFSLFKKKKDSRKGGVSPFAALSTALAATVGTGNIVGVSLAIRIGGPGAIFWMWMSALLGMVIKYSEVSLAVFYREKLPEKGYGGGPMYYMKKGLKFPALAFVFCFFGMFTSFGIGNMVQANSFSCAAESLFGMKNWISGVLLSFLCGAVLIGGIKRISSVAEFLVPFMALFYILICTAVLFLYSDKIPQAFCSIISSAFSPAAPMGGFSGASAAYAIRIGTARGLFTNEAGLGSAPIAHACADTDHPAHQGLWGAFEVFFDTIVMCTITAVVVLVSDAWISPSSVDDSFIAHFAFSSVFPIGAQLVNASLLMFSFASIAAWYFYGEKCAEFLFSRSFVPIYRVLYVSACFFGAIFAPKLIWEISDTLNAFMAIPNLIALFLLAPKVRQITSDFFKK